MEYLLRQNWHDQINDFQTQSWLKRDSNVFLHQSLSTPCLDVLECAQGPYLENLAGHSYLDFHGNSVHQLGHAHPNIVNAIKQQLARLTFRPRRFTNSVAINCAERLCELTNGVLQRVLFAPGGLLQLVWRSN